MSRAPHGARGLKQRVDDALQFLLESRPAWGAWIETRYSLLYICASSSRPAWGAWIETRNGSVQQNQSMSRPAWGAWIETLSPCASSHAPTVAPRMGRVD